MGPRLIRAHTAAAIAAASTGGWGLRWAEGLAATLSSRATPAHVACKFQAGSRLEHGGWETPTRCVQSKLVKPLILLT